jgi:hypothetical protein
LFTLGFKNSKPPFLALVIKKARSAKAYSTVKYFIFSNFNESAPKGIESP